jgi:hypothetical protein
VKVGTGKFLRNKEEQKMYICQLPKNVQEEIRKDLETYMDTYMPFEFTTDEREEEIEKAMSEQLKNILDINEETVECGLSTEKYGKYL